LVREGPHRRHSRQLYGISKAKRAGDGVTACSQ
jgi:hypothetical protein